MKRVIILILFASVTMISKAQVDTSLSGRLNTVLKLTQAKDLEKVMDYTYPKLLTIVPRKQLIEAMKNVYETDEFITELDSLSIIKVYPVFTSGDGNYAKIKHTMLMKMKYKEPIDTADKEGNEMMLTAMEEGFGKGNVRFDFANNSLNVFMTPVIVAIKDKLSVNWTFVTLNEDNPTMLNMLFSKEVIARLKEFE